MDKYNPKEVDHQPCDKQECKQEIINFSSSGLLQFFQVTSGPYVKEHFTAVNYRHLSVKSHFNIIKLKSTNKRL